MYIKSARNLQNSISRSLIEILIMSHNTSSMSLASTFKSASFKHFTNVSHVNGLRPFPHIHFSKISALIFSASRIHLCSMAETIVPLLSLSKSIPKVLYFPPICSAMLMLPCLLGNFSRLGRLGLSPVAKFHV